MRKCRLLILLSIPLILHFGCNKQSIPLNYETAINTEEVDGNLRDMFILKDTLFVVSEDDGLLIYKINKNSEDSSIFLISLLSDSLYFRNMDWNLSGIQYSNSLNTIIILDKFYSMQHTLLTNLFEETDFQFEKVCCTADYQHPSTFTINDKSENLQIFTLIRNKSGQEGVPSDIVSIYKIDIIEISEELIFADEPIKVIDSLIYDATDIHYRDNKLFISHTSNNQNEFSVYKIHNIGFDRDTTIMTPFLPETLYSDESFLFVGMGEHGGVNIYSIDSMEEISWISKGFSVRDIYWNSSLKILLLSCGYQGVVVLELDNDMNVINSWVLNTAYAYTSRDYNGHILVSTRNGIEMFKIK